MNLKTFALGAALIAATGLTAHAADVRTDYDHHVNFSQFHNYCWGQVTTSNPLYVRRIKDEVDKDLQSKGWQKVPSGCDVTLFAKGNVHNQKELQTYYNGLGGGWGGGWGWGGWGWGGWGGWGDGMGQSTTTTINRPVGSLVLDVFDTNNKKLVWRGVSQSNLHNKAEKNTKNLDKDIDKMLKDFPPKK